MEEEKRKGSKVLCGWWRRDAKGEEEIKVDLCDFTLCNLFFQHNYRIDQDVHLLSIH
jgi:hypothetical protein